MSSSHVWVENSFQVPAQSWKFPFFLLRILLNQLLILIWSSSSLIHFYWKLGYWHFSYPTSNSALSKSVYCLIFFTTWFIYEILFARFFFEFQSFLMKPVVYVYDCKVTSFAWNYQYVSVRALVSFEIGFERFQLLQSQAFVFSSM